MNKFFGSQKKKITLFLIVIFFLVGLFVITAGVYAETGVEKALKGLDKTAGEGYLGNPETPPPDTSVSTIVGEIVGAALAFIGLLFLILLIYGGFIWMTAGGNEEKVKKSIDLIIQAIIGLVVVSSAYLIAQFVGETVVIPFIQS